MKVRTAWFRLAAGKSYGERWKQPGTKESSKRNLRLILSAGGGHGGEVLSIKS